MRISSFLASVLLCTACATAQPTPVALVVPVDVGSHVAVAPATQLYRDAALSLPALMTDPTAPTVFALARAVDAVGAVDTVSVALRTGNPPAAACFAGPGGLSTIALTVFVSPSALLEVTTVALEDRLGPFTVTVLPGAGIANDGLHVGVGTLPFVDEMATSRDAISLAGRGDRQAITSAIYSSAKEVAHGW